MTLAKRLAELVRTCFSGIWIESHEHQDALADIAKLCRDENWRLATWDLESGLAINGQSSESGSAGSQDPLAALRSLPAFAAADGSALLVLQNFHRFLASAEILQALIRQVVLGKLQRTVVVILSPVIAIPIELEKLFVVVEHERPSREQLALIARGIATQAGELPDGPALHSVLDAASGLTRHEAEAAFSLSLVRAGRVEADSIWELKTQILKKSGLLTLYRSQENFESLGGMAALKAFSRRALLRPGRDDPRRSARGVLLLGIPGTGKSGFAKTLGAETNRPTLILDIGSLMGSLVGQTETNIRQALAIADAMAPCILFCDEIEKALGGATSGSAGDSGVSSRLLGTLLTWMNDHQSDVYLVATCNDISRFPPEFSRAERFDGVFFLDLPSRAEKDAIWQLYRDYYGLDPEQRLPKDEDWTGAEIRACCRLAALLDLPLGKAAQNVVPVAMTAAESVERLRTWASGRCLAADQSNSIDAVGRKLHRL